MLKMSMETQNKSSTNLDLEDEIKEPPMCKVILLNDDFTTKEFVVEILITLFNKSSLEFPWLPQVQVCSWLPLSLQWQLLVPRLGQVLQPG